MGGARVNERFPGNWNAVRAPHLRAVRGSTDGLEEIGGFRIRWMHLTGPEGPPLRVLRALQVLVGLVIGLPFAWWLAPMMREALFESDPGDPILYVVVPLVLITSALISGYRPVRRALGLEVTEALRVE